MHCASLINTIKIAFIWYGLTECGNESWYDVMRCDVQMCGYNKVELCSFVVQSMDESVIKQALQVKSTASRKTGADYVCVME